MRIPRLQLKRRPRDPQRARGDWRDTLRRLSERHRFLRDVVGAFLLAAVVLGAVAILSGGKWPPVVVVESGSMMHPYVETPYGRWGTIDVGDIVFVRDVDAADEVEMWIDGGPLHYRRPGDVIAFAANGDRMNATQPMIIHRAITYVEVDNDVPGRTVTYTMRWIDGQTLTWGPQGIYFPPLGFHEKNGFSPQNGYRPPHSGFLTKGDNAFTNPAVDQALGLTHAVDPTWVEGTIHGELPWMGLGKLGLQMGRTNPEVPGWERVGNAFAPIELWTMFFLVTAASLIIPSAIDTARAIRRHRERIAFEKRVREEVEQLKRAQKAKRREPVAFTAIDPNEHRTR